MITVYSPSAAARKRDVFVVRTICTGGWDCDCGKWCFKSCFWWLCGAVLVNSAVEAEAFGFTIPVPVAFVVSDVKGWIAVAIVDAVKVVADGTAASLSASKFLFRIASLFPLFLVLYTESFFTYELIDWHWPVKGPFDLNERLIGCLG